jgi:hypothetical protein
VGLRVEQGEGAAPGAAEDDVPLLDADVTAELLDIIDEVGGGVLSQVGAGRGLAGAALVEEDYAVDGWVEELGVVFGGVPPWPAVEEDRCVNSWSVQYTYTWSRFHLSLGRIFFAGISRPHCHWKLGCLSLIEIKSTEHSPPTWLPCFVPILLIVKSMDAADFQLARVKGAFVPVASSVLDADLMLCHVFLWRRDSADQATYVPVLSRI